MNTSNPKFDDALLSAYLDQELSGSDLASVETALATQPEVAQRLATLQRVNELALMQASAIDAQPLPAALLAMLESGTVETAQHRAPVISLLGRIQQRQTFIKRPLAMAAGLVLAVGLSVVMLQEFRGQNNSLPALAAYTDILDSATSGTTVTRDEFVVTPQFSFLNFDSAFCRVYRLESPVGNSANLACRKDGEWQLHTSLATAVTAGTEQYVPASNPAMQLDSVLDQLMPDAPLNQEQEANYLQPGSQRF